MLWSSHSKENWHNSWMVWFSSRVHWWPFWNPNLHVHSSRASLKEKRFKETITLRWCMKFQHCSQPLTEKKLYWGYHQNLIHSWKLLAKTSENSSIHCKHLPFSQNWHLKTCGHSMEDTTEQAQVVPNLFKTFFERPNFYNNIYFGLLCFLFYFFY